MLETLRWIVTLGSCGVALAALAYSLHIRSLVREGLTRLPPRGAARERFLLARRVVRAADALLHGAEGVGAWEELDQALLDYAAHEGEHGSLPL